jgi:hypothetical protein
MSMCENPQVVFDVANHGYTAWWFPAAGIGFMIISILLFRHERSERQNKRHWQTTFMVAFSTVWTVVALVGTGREYLRARAARSAGTFQTVEGVVQDFVPEPYSGHAEESFKVAGIPFRYSDYVVTAGYHQSRSHGGVIEPGLHVRVGYLDGVILKLEVCR